jgi:hypothetical protein
MDRTGWFIVLGIQISGVIVGALAAITPPWESLREHFAMFERGAFLGFTSAAGLVLLFGLGSVAFSIAARLGYAAPSSPVFRPGPSRACVGAYALFLVLSIAVSSWFLWVGIVITSVLAVLAAFSVPKPQPIHPSQVIALLDHNAPGYLRSATSVDEKIEALHRWYRTRNGIRILRAVFLAIALGAGWYAIEASSWVAVVLALAALASVWKPS